MTLPTGFGKRTSDHDEMVKERSIRALVIINPIGSFDSGGKPEGIQHGALEDSEKFANQKLNIGKLPLKVVPLPMRPEQLEAALKILEMSNWKQPMTSKRRRVPMSATSISTALLTSGPGAEATETSDAGKQMILRHARHRICIFGVLLCRGGDGR